MSEPPVRPTNDDWLLAYGLIRASAHQKSDDFAALWDDARAPQVALAAVGIAGLLAANLSRVIADPNVDGLLDAMVKERVRREAKRRHDVPHVSPRTVGT